MRRFSDGRLHLLTRWLCAVPCGTRRSDVAVTFVTVSFSILRDEYGVGVRDVGLLYYCLYAIITINFSIGKNRVERR
jgi:hypothetical protein